MSIAKHCLVATSIHKGEFLDSYCQQADAEQIRDRLTIIVIPDRKSPETLYARCHELSRRGFHVICPTLSQQDAHVKRFGFGSHLVPFDSDNRRNVGFLMALDLGCQILISLDDDNYCTGSEAFFQQHAVVNRDEITSTTVQSSTGWYNICDLLEISPALDVYPRGFPYKERFRKPVITRSQEQGVVRLNAGLWLAEPDLDAITWLASPVCAQAMRGDSVLLGRDTWSPINTQNTALHRDVICCFYFVRMGFAIGGMPIDRYGDIFSGYFCQACVRHCGHRIRVGAPAALHKRNSHDYLRDATHELACIWLLEDLTGWLREVKLAGSNYADAYLSLSEALEDQVERFSGFIWTDAARAYFHHVAYCMRQWVAACRLLN
jgi:hypothetical protein